MYHSQLLLRQTELEAANRRSILEKIRDLDKSIYKKRSQKKLEASNSSNVAVHVGGMFEKAATPVNVIEKREEEELSRTNVVAIALIAVFAAATLIVTSAAIPLTLFCIAYAYDIPRKYWQVRSCRLRVVATWCVILMTVMFVALIAVLLSMPSYLKRTRMFP